METNDALDAFIAGLPDDDVEVLVTAIGDEDVTERMRPGKSGRVRVTWEDASDLQRVASGELLLEAVGYAGRLTVEGDVQLIEQSILSWCEPANGEVPLSDLVRAWQQVRDGAAADALGFLNARGGLEVHERRRSRAYEQAWQIGRTPSEPVRVGMAIADAGTYWELSLEEDRTISLAFAPPSPNADFVLTWLKSVDFLRELAGELSVMDALIAGQMTVDGDGSLLPEVGETITRFW